MNEDFYKNLKGFGQFSELSDRHFYVTAPPDWYVVVADVKGSTEAILQGKYKEINLVGASTIIALLNLAPDVSIPYSFGGDGATLLIPPSMLDQTLTTLKGVIRKVKLNFDLELRAGCIPLKALYEQGATLMVAKFLFSPHVSGAVFQGNALAMAETWLKKGGGTVLYGDVESEQEPDLGGLECRWQPIDNRHGKMISMLVRTAPSYTGDAWKLYEDCIRDIEAIYPEHQNSAPVSVSGMRLNFSPRHLLGEAKQRTKTPWGQALYVIRAFVLNSIGQFSFVTGKKVIGFDGKKYLQELVANSDVRKFDEMLRMVLDSTDAQHQALEKVLNERYQKGQIVYGLYESPQALMTCMVFNLSGNHVHLVDGSDGGYALAAKQMKEQLRTVGA